MHHYPPQARAATETAVRFPIVLCHDIGSNAAIWEIGPAGGLAQYLSAQGFDVWAVDLRGCGQSRKEGWVGRDEVKKDSVVLESRFQKENWNLDDIIHLDLPAILGYVKEQTAQPQLSWVGLGTGASIMAGFLQTHEDEAVRNFVAIGMPMVYPRPANDIVRHLIKQQDLASLLALLNGRWLDGDKGAQIPDTPLTIEDLFFYAPNMDGAVMERIRQNATEDIAPGELEQWAWMMRSGEFVSSDKRINYAKSMERIATPTLFLAGPLDNMAGLPGVYYAFEQFSGTDKLLKVMQISYGSGAEYGHWDMVCGRNAAVDTYPYLADWLKERS